MPVRRRQPQTEGWQGGSGACDADDEEVILQVTVPYALRRAARAAHLDCSALTRKALAKQLKKAARD